MTNEGRHTTSHVIETWKKRGSEKGIETVFVQRANPSPPTVRLRSSPALLLNFFMHYVSNKVVQGLLRLEVQEEACSTVTTATAPLLPNANSLTEGIPLGMLRTPAEKRLKRNPWKASWGTPSPPPWRTVKACVDADLRIRYQLCLRQPRTSHPWNTFTFCHLNLSVCGTWEASPFYLIFTVFYLYEMSCAPSINVFLEPSRRPGTEERHLLLSKEPGVWNLWSDFTIKGKK